MNSEAPIPIVSRYLGLNRESRWVGVITFNTRGPGAGPIPLQNSNTHKYFFRREKVDLTCKVYWPETICLIMDGKKHHFKKNSVRARWTKFDTYNRDIHYTIRNDPQEKRLHGQFWILRSTQSIEQSKSKEPNWLIG